MRTVGEILKKTRLNQKLSLNRISQQTKINQKYLIALEENRYQDLPSAAYIQGFIKNYSQILGLETQSLLAIFRRDYQERIKPPFRFRDEKKFFWSPKLTRAFLVSLGLIIFLVYLFWQYRIFLRSPYLQ